MTNATTAERRAGDAGRSTQVTASTSDDRVAIVSATRRRCRICGPSGRLDVRHRDDGERERDEPDRDVDPEDPAPAPAVGDEAAEQRADEDRDRERGADDREYARPLARRASPRR